MQAIELKVPPPLVAALVAFAMYLAAAQLPQFQYPFPLRLPAGLALGLVGLAVNVAGLLAFRRHRTTVNPMRPDRASSLVRDGIFRHTRNPMYLGMVLILCGWAVILANAAACVGPLLLFAWLTRFQIVPEERAMRSKFQQSFADYAGEVGRWL